VKKEDDIKMHLRKIRYDEIKLELNDSENSSEYLDFTTLLTHRVFHDLERLSADVELVSERSWCCAEVHCVAKFLKARRLPPSPRGQKTVTIKHYINTE
jgi:hypothetical protein